MRHARQTPAQRRGGESVGSAWPSIVATTCSLSGAAAGITSLALWSDTFHLRLGIGMAAAGAIYASIAMMGRWRDRNSRREALAEARQDAAAELRFEIGRRDGQISGLHLRVREAEELVLLFEQRVKQERARADAADMARVRAEHDLARLTAWAHQASAAAELTRSAVQSVQSVQPFEPVAARGFQAFERTPYESAVSFQSSQAFQPSAYEPAYAPPSYESLQPVAVSVPEPAPVRAPRPLRSTELAVREEIGFDVAADVYSAQHEPYLVPGVTMPRPRNNELTSSSRPIAPERLYRPYLESGRPASVDLTLFDDTTQIKKVNGYQSETG